MNKNSVKKKRKFQMTPRPPTRRTQAKDATTGMKQEEGFFVGVGKVQGGTPVATFSLAV
jgi:hypothetical protein